MDQRGIFVDRPVPVALFERLYLADRAGTEPLPIVVVYGPSGSGKTRLLDYLYSRGKDPLTCARVRVNPESGPSSLPELLDSLQEELASDRNPQCGLIPFPRYELCRWMREIAPKLGAHPDLESIRKQLRTLLNRRFRVPGDAGRENIFVAAAHLLVNLLLPAVLTRPSVLRRILWGRNRNTGFLWYEQGQHAIELPEGRHFSDVIRRVCALANTGDPQDAALLDELLLSAFLDDLRAAFDPDRTSLARLRTTYCVALVDDIDRLPNGQGFRLLEMLAEQRANGSRDPLLLIATGEQWWSHAGRPFPVSSGSGDPAGTAAEVLASWRNALHRFRDQRNYPIGSLFLRIDLPPLTREQTRRLVLPPRPRPSTESREVLAEEVFQATHGHPLAVHLVTQALAGRRPGAPRLGVRRLMDEPLPSGAHDPSSGESIGSHLVQCFIEPVRRRLDRGILVACAAPRALDAPTLRAALGLSDDDSGRTSAAEVWDELARHAFTEVASDGRLVMHPLLRDLLIRELAAGDDRDGPLSHSRIHARLDDHFAVVAEERPEAMVDRLYHELARGQVQPVLRALEARVNPDDPAWRGELLAVARAPSSPRRSRRFFLRRRAESPLGILLDRAGELYSPISDAPWSVELLERLAEDLSEVEAGERTAGRYTPADRSVRLIRPLEPPRDAAPPGDGQRPLVRADESESFPVPRRTSHRALWRAAAVFVLLAPLLLYLGAYRMYSVETCGPAGPLDVWTVVTDRTVNDGLHVRHAGGNGSGPCVGITDGNDYVFAKPATEDVQNRIADQNEQVLRQSAETGRPYLTAVVMTTLTAPGDGSNKEASAGRSELEGVYLAQQRYNNEGHVPMLRVLVANVGTAGEHAADVAQQLVRAARRDRTIVAVLGLGSGTGETLQAVRILGRAGLPTIASTASGDAFRNVSDHFFRVGVPNRRQAAVSAAYAKEELDATTAIIVEDPTDTYSRSLARDFEEEFEDGKHTLRWPGRLTYDASRPDVTNTLANRVSRACLQDPDVIFYAGRADHMDTVLNATVDAPCNPDVAIMGGQDLALLSLPPFPQPLPEIRNPLYYTTMATPDAWQAGRGPRFYGAYRSYLRGIGASAAQQGTAPSEQAALAYDATSVLTYTLIRIPDADEIDAFAVWRGIRLTTGTNLVAGVGGVIDFGSDPDGDPLDKAVMLMRADEYGKARWLGTCGQLGEDPTAVATPPQEIPCPE
ncbi:MAG: ABC transporter substrate-binding protein [Streptosporangiales bacterium]|nr:ABC transporter substrate-binding protein [Streptosporangiales bacterium]